MNRFQQAEHEYVNLVMFKPSYRKILGFKVRIYKKIFSLKHVTLVFEHYTLIGRSVSEKKSHHHAQLDEIYRLI